MLRFFNDRPVEREDKKETKDREDKIGQKQIIFINILKCVCALRARRQALAEHCVNRQ